MSRDIEDDLPDLIQIAERGVHISRLVDEWGATNQLAGWQQDAVAQVKHALGDVGTIHDPKQSWQTMSEIQQLFLCTVLHDRVSTITASIVLNEHRHKDDRADKDFVQDWYQKNRHRFTSKNAAAKYIHEHKLVSQALRTIRDWLINL